MTPKRRMLKLIRENTALHFDARFSVRLASWVALRCATSVVAASLLLVATNSSAQTEAKNAASSSQASSRSGKSAAKVTTSAQALRALTHADAGQRRIGIIWLAERGQHRQALQLAPLLKDDDSVNRHMAEQAMWLMWSRSGDTRFDARFTRAVNQLAEGNFAAAIDAFSGLIRVKPELAEAWNKRATANFLAGKLDESLADCDEVIKRNPVHFGALSGYGQIYSKRGEFEQALEYFYRALEVNPNMTAVQANIRVLERLIDERRKSST